MESKTYTYLRYMRNGTTRKITAVVRSKRPAKK